MIKYLIEARRLRVFIHFVLATFRRKHIFPERNTIFALADAAASPEKKLDEFCVIHLKLAQINEYIGL